VIACLALTDLRSDKVDFGALRLAAGRHRLRFTAVGKNRRASRSDLAVDCLALLPTGQ
jgi:hypothetical protein